MKRALFINLALVLAIGLGFILTACQQSAKTTVVKCPLQQMGQPCTGDETACPIPQGKDPCVTCVTTAKQLQAKTVANKCAHADKCDKDGKCVGTCTDKDKANCDLHKK